MPARGSTMGSQNSVSLSTSSKKVGPGDPAAHRLARLPLLPSGPGGVRRIPLHRAQPRFNVARKPFFLDRQGMRRQFIPSDCDACCRINVAQEHCFSIQSGIFAKATARDGQRGSLPRGTTGGRHGPSVTQSPALTARHFRKSLEVFLRSPRITRLGDRLQQTGCGGEGGIRTHGRVAPTHAFQACRFGHSRTSPQHLFSEKAS